MSAASCKEHVFQAMQMGNVATAANKPGISAAFVGTAGS
jgi:hypothetical protein